MNRTQQITCDWLNQSGLIGDALLLEALLRRGFLAYSDNQGVWLGTGSHPEDIAVLRLLDGLAVEPLSGHSDRMARLSLKSPDVSVMRLANAIVALLENHDGNHSLWTGWGIPNYRGTGGWNSCRKMTWGAKLAVCPTRDMRKSEAQNALDLGVGLLIKAFPLARVATRASCDGHGGKPAWISLSTVWDLLWAKAVFDALGTDTPNSAWDWTRDLHIQPLGGWGDAEVLGMLNDIQHVARRLLHQRTIDTIGHARQRTMTEFGNLPPDSKRFSEVAMHQLTTEFR